MKNRILFFGTLVVISVSCFMCSFLPGTEPSKDKTVVTENVMSSLLQMGHFKPRNLDDKFSEDVYDLYLKRIDINKKFLLQSDIDELKAMRTEIDDQLKADNFVFFTKSTEMLNKRYADVEGFYKDLLKEPFDFSKDEKIETDPKKLNYAADTVKHNVRNGESYLNTKH
jgi:carboxyl-terminal processing protease